MSTIVEDRLKELESAIEAIEAQLEAIKDILSSMMGGSSSASDAIAGGPLDISIDDVDIVPLDEGPFEEKNPLADNLPVASEEPVEPEEELEAPEAEVEMPEVEVELPDAEPEAPQEEPVAREGDPEVLFDDFVEDVPVSPKKLAVIDVVPDAPSWKTDRPGVQVKNILSAISLNDRISFISGLFHKDPLLFQSTLNRINSMTSFQEAEEYVLRNFPEWKLDSDAVYRFMMAVRRRFN